MLIKKSPLISLCMMVKNEAKTLLKCLDSIVEIADEVIIVDTGSTDGTQEIIKKYQQEEYYFEWNDDFADARNYVASLARGKYICRWDADWILRKGDLEYILTLKEKEFENADEVHFNWINEYNEQTLEPVSSVTHMFLYKREGFEWYCAAPAHDMIRLINPHHKIKKVAYSDIWVYHEKDPVEKTNRYDQTHELIRQQIYSAHSNYPRLGLLQFYLSSCVFREEFEEASWVVEEIISKLTPKNPVFYQMLEQHIQILTNIGKLDIAYERAHYYYYHYYEYHTVLSFADISSLLNKPESVELFNQFLTLPKNQESLNINYERYVVHPLLMLGYLTKNISMLEEAFKKSRKPSTQQKITIIISRFVSNVSSATSIEKN